MGALFITKEGKMMAKKSSTEKQLEAELSDLQQAYNALKKKLSDEKKPPTEASISLSDTYKRYHYLLEHLQAGIVVHAPDTSIITANSIATELLGLPLQQMKGRQADDPVWHFIDEAGEFVSVDQYPVQRICAGAKSIRNQVLGICRDGKDDVVWVSVNAFQLLDEAGRMKEILTSFIDISIQKNQEIALKQSEERFKKMFERHGAIMLLIDPETGNIIDGNQAAAEFYGYSKEKLSQINISDINMLENNQVRDFMRMALMGEMDVFMFPHRLSNGQERMVEVHSAPIDFQGQIILYSIIHDVTERWHSEVLLQQKTAEIEAQNEEFIQINEELNQSNNELVDALARAEASEQRFRLAMKASNDGLFDWNLLTNEIYYSPGWKRMLGYEEDELPNDFSIWEKLTEDADVRHSWDLQRQLINKEIDRFVVEFKMKHKNGHWIDVLARAEAVFDPSGKAVRIVGTHTDITEQKKAEASLRKSENRYRLLHENAGLGIGYYTTDGTIISFNKLAAAHMGGSPHDFAGKRLSDIFSGDETAIYLERIRLACESQEAREYEDCIELPTGKKCFLSTYARIEDENHQVMGVQVISQDISELKKTQTELIEARKNAEASEERLKLVIKASNDAPWDWDLVNNQLFYSPQWWAQLGYQPNELKDDPDLWERLLYPGDQTAVDEVFRGALKLGKESYEFEFRLKHKDGHYVPILTKGYITYNSEGKPIRVTGTNVDLTQRKKAEQDLIAAKERAEESDRLKSAFLANMSHEIRTPMNGILGFADLLREPNLTGEQQQKFIGIIQKSGERMLRIINDIIDISKIEAGLIQVQKQPSNVNEQIEYIYTFFKPEAAAKGLTLSYRNELPPHEAVIQTDREKVFAILTNLVKNAIKYTDEGSIEMGCNCLHDEKSSYLQFYVKDTGIGVPEDRREAIFERFVQADIGDAMARQGAGLGLAITRSYVEMLGGRIWLESEVNRGSTFYFTLPFQQVDEQPTFPAEESDTGQTNSGKIKPLKILVVEDDVSSGLYFDIVLAPFAREIFKAKTGVEAVEKFKENQDIDLILMDIQLPRMNGHEATREIRKMSSKVIIIAQTAYAQAVDRRRALEAGCDDYVSKPVKKNTLLTLIKQYFAK